MCELLLFLLLEWNKNGEEGDSWKTTITIYSATFFLLLLFVETFSALDQLGFSFENVKGKGATYTHAGPRKISLTKKEKTRRRRRRHRLLLFCFSRSFFFVFFCFFVFIFQIAPVRWLLALHCDVMAVALGVRSSLPSYAFLVTLQVEINCSRPLLDPCPIFLLFGHFPPNMEEHCTLRSSSSSTSLFLHTLVERVVTTTTNGDTQATVYLLLQSIREIWLVILGPLNSFRTFYFCFVDCDLPMQMTRKITIQGVGNGFFFFRSYGFLNFINNNPGFWFFFFSLNYLFATTENEGHGQVCRFFYVY